MILKLFIVAVVFLFAVSGKAQRPDFSVSELTDRSVLSRLFDGQSFDSKGRVMWKPTFADSMAFDGNVWSDGYCHTKLDTILIFTLNDGLQRAYLVFSTVSEDECRYCYPDIGAAEFLRSRDNRWIIDGFVKKLGRYGGEDNVDNGPRIALQKAGPETFLLELSGWIGTNPEAIEIAHFFDMYGEVFATTTHYENEYPTYKWDRTLKFIVPKDQSDLSSTDCYDIVALLSGIVPVDPDDADSASKKYSRKEHYEYNFDLHRYQFVK